MVDKDIINAEEISEKFSITKRTLQNWIKSKSDFPKPFKANRRLLWKRSDVEAYIEYLKKTKPE